MRHFITILLIFCLALLLSCSTTSDPDDDPPDDPPQVEETIGPEGGVISTDGFELTVPPGAFDEDVDLAISLADEDQAPSHELASELFLLEGMPDLSHEPLRLVIEPTEPLSGLTMVLKGQVIWSGEVHEETLEYVMLEAEIENDQVVLEIPAYDLTSQRGAEGERANLELEGPWGLTTDLADGQSDHFWVFAADVGLPLDEFAAKLETMFQLAGSEFGIDLESWIRSDKKESVNLTV